MVHRLSANASCKQYLLQQRCPKPRKSVILCSEPPDEERPRGRSAPVEEFNTWPATAPPPPRRLIVGLSTAAITALAANFLGVTSSLLGLGDGELASQLKLDSLYSVNGSKRYLGSGFEVLYPSEWLQDVTLYRRRVEQAEFSRGLDFQDIDQMERAARGRSVVQPSIAFGPAGGSGVDNISVITAPSPGLRLQELGSPESVADFLLQTQLAPPGGGKVAQLLSASSHTDTRGVIYYSIEYQVRKEGTEGWQRHNLAVLSAQQGVLYTFNAQCAEARWASLGPQFQRSAASFTLLAV